MHKQGLNLGECSFLVMFILMAWANYGYYHVVKKDTPKLRLSRWRRQSVVAVVGAFIMVCFFAQKAITQLKPRSVDQLASFLILPEIFRCPLLPEYFLRIFCNTCGHCFSVFAQIVPSLTNSSPGILCVWALHS